MYNMQKKKKKKKIYKNTRSRYIIYGKTFLTWKIIDI